MPRQILFLCTGNYYRSRFAEALFNHLAKKAGLDWIATSCGLALEKGHNIGPIARDTAQALLKLQIPLAEPIRPPRQVCEEDLAAADLVVALKEAEHRAYLTERYPDWPDRVRYWNVHDLDLAQAREAIAEIESLVSGLVEELRTRDEKEPATSR